MYTHRHQCLRVIVQSHVGVLIIEDPDGGPGNLLLQPLVGESASLCHI